MKLLLNLLLFGMRILTGVHEMMAVKRQHTVLESWRASQMWCSHYKRPSVTAKPAVNARTSGMTCMLFFDDKLESRSKERKKAVKKHHRLISHLDPCTWTTRWPPKVSFATSNSRQHAVATFERWDEWDDIYAVCSFNEQRRKTVKKPHIFERWDEWSDITGWDTEKIQRREDTAEIDCPFQCLWWLCQRNLICKTSTVKKLLIG